MVKTADTNQTTLLSKVVKYCDKIGASISSEKWDVVLGDSFLEEAISGPMRENTYGGSVDASLSLSPEAVNDLQKIIGLYKNEKVDIFGWDKLVHVFGDLEFYYFYLQLLKENSSNISLNIDLSSMFEITDFGEIAYLKNFSKLNTILDTIKDLSQSITITGLSKIVTNPFGALFCNSDSFKQFVEALSWDVVTIPEEDECGLQYLNLQSQIATIVSKEQKDKSDESDSDSEQNITTDFIPDEVDESFAPYQGIIF